MGEFYRGYIPTKNKKGTMKFKGVADSALLTLEQAQEYGEYAGIMADDAILVDVDDMAQATLLLDIVEDKEIRCRVLESRSGMHFLFKNSAVRKCPNRVKLACGITADIKSGFKSSYEVLKIDGKEREVLYDILDNEEYQEVPKWLFPVKTDLDFFTMENGDGRNQTLFNYILTLQSTDFSVEECRETIRIINDYILPEKLDREEIEKILRDDAFQKESFFKGGTFLHDKFATYLKNNHHIIKIDGKLHIYQDGIYQDGESLIEYEMIQHIPNLTQAKRREVLSYLDASIRRNTKPADANYVAFKNGIFDISRNELIPFTPDIIMVNRVPWDYVPGAYFELGDKVLNKVSNYDPEIRQLLEEAIGYTFYRRNELRKAFILTGKKRNGKSTYLDMIVQLLGAENVSSLDIGEIGDKFKTAELFGKLANAGDDINDNFIMNPAILKKVISGENITVEEKGVKPYKFTPYCKFLFSANTIPRIKDKSGAVLDRFIIIPFKKEFTKQDPDYDPYIKYKLRCRECMEYLIQIGIAALKRVLENQEFSHSKAAKEEWHNYEIMNNPVLEFFKDTPVGEVVNETLNDVYRKYKEFCIANGFTEIAANSFSRKAQEFYKIITIRKKVGGKLYQVFIDKNEQKTIKK